MYRLYHRNYLEVYLNEKTLAELLIYPIDHRDLNTRAGKLTKKLDFH